MSKALKGKGPSFTFISPNRKLPRGFTLVEIMIVIAIIVVIATLAVPVTLRSRLQSNETATIANLRTVSSACESFRATQNPPAYPSSFSDLINSTPPYLDGSWSTSLRQGYLYTFLRSGDGETFSAGGRPRSAAVTGVNSYCVDQTATIRKYSDGADHGSAGGCDAGGTAL